ncbi:MAG: hypothetical protein PVJ27_00990 [Candidatus Brocadiaceae bacterium]|jgi:hypothetical protein
MAGKEQEEGRFPFAGKPLRDIPLPAATVLRDDEFGEAVLSAYHDTVKREFSNHEHLRIFKAAGGAVHGSNPFACVVLDSIVRPELRVATPPDIQAILDARGKTRDALTLQGFYKDTALALRGIREPNSYLAQSLNEQVGLQIELPLIIYLSGLRLTEDTASPYGLSFRLTENSTYFTAPVLAEKSDHFNSSAVDRATGLPVQLGGTERYFYSMEEGLSRIYVGRGLSIDTIWDEMANSQADGRVVFVDNSVPAGKVSQYLGRLDKATDLLED